MPIPTPTAVFNDLLALMAGDADAPFEASAVQASAAASAIGDLQAAGYFLVPYAATDDSDPATGSGDYWQAIRASRYGKAYFAHAPSAYARLARVLLAVVFDASADASTPSGPRPE